MFSYVFIICLSDYSLTYRLSYPKSRDAIASKKILQRLLKLFELFFSDIRVNHLNSNCYTSYDI